jgi:DNA replication protein
MNDDIIKILKEKPLTIPKILFQNYKKMNITEEELIILIYLMNIDNKIVYNPDTLSKELNLDKFKVMQLLNNLCEKNIISIKVEKNETSKVEEYIYLDLLYTKLFNNIIDKKEEKQIDSTDVFTIFETELGRTLSAMECEIIKGWLNDNISKEILIEALKEAVYNDAKSLKYIDRILYSWRQKGIKTKEDVIKDKINYRNSKQQQVQVFDYNWLEDD